MAFNFFNQKGIQKLYRKQFRKIIKRFGIPCYYVKKALSGSLDKLYGEDNAISYDTAFEIKMYLETFEFYDGSHQTFNAFLSLLEDSLRFKIDIETFKEVTGMDFPEEGDLICIGLSPALKIVTPDFKALETFIIRGVNRRADFYSFGTFFSHALECNRFEYNHQKFNTGVELIDSLNLIDTVKSISDIIGDNKIIDQIDAEGVEAYDSETGTIQQGSPVTEFMECDPMKPDSNETPEIPQPEDVEWDPNDPYGDKCCNG